MLGRKGSFSLTSTDENNHETLMLKADEMTEKKVVRKWLGEITPVEAYLSRCGKIASERGFVLHGIVGEYRGSTSKLKLECKEHGVWETANINNFIRRPNGCPGCNYKIAAISRKKPLSVMSEKFMASGGFSTGTTFERSERLSTTGTKPFWRVKCGKCGDKYESPLGNLKRGSIACQCSIFRQKECYVNALKDGETIVAIKFGIAVNTKGRIKQQKSSTSFKIENLASFRFASCFACRRAEKVVKLSFDCGVVLQRDMPDGYTETTSVKNYERICEMFVELGGVRV